MHFSRLTLAALAASAVASPVLKERELLDLANIISTPLLTERDLRDMAAAANSAPKLQERQFGDLLGGLRGGGSSSGFSCKPVIFIWARGTFEPGEMVRLKFQNVPRLCERRYFAAKPLITGHACRPSSVQCLDVRWNPS